MRGDRFPSLKEGRLVRSTDVVRFWAGVFPSLKEGRLDRIGRFYLVGCVLFPSLKEGRLVYRPGIVVGCVGVFPSLKEGRLAPGKVSRG